jgi:hypothetical protein
VREYLLWESGAQQYREDSYLERPFTFAGQPIDIRDDQPTDSVTSEREYEGVIQILIDGQPLGPPARALVRRGRTDLGRYHLWFSAWTFTDRATGRTTLWLARRHQPDSTEGPRFEVTTVAEDGTRETRLLRQWQLGTSYPLFRSTQFVRDGSFFAIPLSMLEAFIFPPILLMFPIGTLIVGVVLVRRGTRTHLVRAAA